MAYRHRNSRVPRHRYRRFSRNCPPGMYFNHKEGRCKPHEPSYTERRRDRSTSREETGLRMSDALQHAVTAAIYATSQTPYRAGLSTVRRPVPVRTGRYVRSIAEPYLRLGYGSQRRQRFGYYGRGGSYTTPSRGGRGGFHTPFPRPFETTPRRRRRRNSRTRGQSYSGYHPLPYI